MTDAAQVLAYMLGMAEADGLDLQSNAWRSAMIDARAVLGFDAPEPAPAPCHSNPQDSTE